MYLCNLCDSLATTEGSFTHSPTTTTTTEGSFAIAEALLIYFSFIFLQLFPLSEGP